MDRLMQTMHRATRYGAWFGGALIILSAAIVAFEVVIRKLFSLSIGGADELSGFALAIGSAWAFGYALMERAHIRIDSLYVWLPVPVRAVLDVLGLVIFTIFFGLIMMRGWATFADTVELDAHTMSPLATPLAYPQFLWAAGLTFLTVVATLLSIQAAVHLLKGRFIDVQVIAGSKTTSEELKEELEIERQLKESGRSQGRSR